MIGKDIITEVIAISQTVTVSLSAVILELSINSIRGIRFYYIKVLLSEFAYYYNQEGCTYRHIYVYT